MAIHARCPACAICYTLRDEFKGKQVRCISCKQVFLVMNSLESRQPSSFVDEDDEDESQFGHDSNASGSFYDDDDHDSDEDESYGGPANYVRRKPPRVTSRRKKGSSVDPSIVVGVVGGLSCMLLILFMIMSSVNREPESKSKDSGNRNSSNVSVLDRSMGSPAPSASTKRIRNLSSQRKFVTDIIASIESMGQDLAAIRTWDQVDFGFMALNIKQALARTSRFNFFGVFTPTVSEMAVLHNEFQQRMESAVQKMEREYDRVTQIPGLKMRTPRPDFAKYRSILSTRSVPDNSVKWPSREEYAEIRVKNTPSQEAADKLQARLLGLVDHGVFAAGKVKFVPGEGSRHTIYPVNDLGAIDVRLKFGKIISKEHKTIQAEMSDETLGISNAQAEPVKNEPH